MVVTIVILIYASWRDYVCREVSNKLWAIYAPIALTLTLSELLLFEQDSLLWFGVSVGVTFAIALLLFYTGGFGGADSKALMCIALALPFANIELTPVLACKVACAVATYAKAKSAIVARDTRVSGPMLEDALVSALLSCGCDVLLTDMVPTPVLAYAAKFYGADVGFMLTASHNPAEYNGVKVFISDLSYTDADAQAVEKIIAEGKNQLADWRKLGRVTQVDAQRAYMDMVLKNVKLKKQWKVVVDAGCADQEPAVFKCETCAINS